MNRRALLKQIALLTGATFVGGEFLLSGCKSGAGTDAAFTPATLALLDEVGETIIPATDTPGAKAAQIGAFMQVMVNDCYTAKEQAAFKAGIAALDEACRNFHGQAFMDCNTAQRKSFLLHLEKEAKAYNEKTEQANAGKKEEEKAPLHYYTMMKQLTLFGFFTSKTGATETLRHLPVPGKYDGAFPYQKGDRAWSE